METDLSARPAARHLIDPVNTLTWFAMDALWLCKLSWPAYIAAGVTVVTGVLLLVAGWRAGRGLVYENLGLNCWIVMNTAWMVHDLNGLETPWWVAAVFGGLGGVFVLLALRHSQHLRRLRIFRR
jgi:hypothetical protein